MSDIDIAALIAEAREYADFGNGLNWQGKIRELADALESRPLTADRTAILDAYGPIVDAVVAVLRPVADVQAEAWECGLVDGTSITMRRMSDEPNAPEPENPYRTPASPKEGND